MFDLEGQRYLWDTKVEEDRDAKIFTPPSVEMNKENADLIFTALLEQVGLARAPVGDGKTFRLVRGALRKEMEVPTVDVSYDKAPLLPNTWDWMSMRYHLKSAETAATIESSYRLHLPRESRMQADVNSGFLIITGNIPLLRQMYETIRAADKPLTAVARKQYEEWQRENRARRAAMDGIKPELPKKK